MAFAKNIVDLSLRERHLRYAERDFQVKRHHYLIPKVLDIAICN
jgi:hypothetical protein